MRGKEIKVLMPEVGDFNEGLESHYVCLQGFQIGLSDTVVGVKDVGEHCDKEINQRNQGYIANQNEISVTMCQPVLCCCTFPHRKGSPLPFPEYGTA